MISFGEQTLLRNSHLITYKYYSPTCMTPLQVKCILQQKKNNTRINIYMNIYMCRKA